MATPCLPAPKTLAESGLSPELLTQLILKILYFSGELTGGDLVRRLGLQYSVVEPVMDALKVQHDCEVVGSGILGGTSNRYRITTQGREVAMHFLRQDQYVGVAPVPIAQYRAYMTAHNVEGVGRVAPDNVRDVLKHLVLSDPVLDEIGAAANGGDSVFLFGPPRHRQTAQVVPQGRQLRIAHHLTLAAPVGPHQQAWALRIACQGEQREQVGLAVADAHQGGLGHLGGEVRQAEVGREPVSYTHLRAHETVLDLVCRLLLEKKNNRCKSLTTIDLYVKNVCSVSHLTIVTSTASCYSNSDITFVAV